MEYRIDVNGTLRTITVRRVDGKFVVALGDRQWTVDAQRPDAHTLSLLLTPGGQGADAGNTGAPREHARVLSRDVSMASVPGESSRMIVSVGSIAVPVAIDGHRRWNGGGTAAAEATGPQRLVAPMPGRVVRVLAQPGSRVAPRQPVVVIEAMKMENELRSPVDGVVSDVLVKEGQSVEAGTVLAVVTPQ